ncbi:MAG: BON domain-containing protein [Acidobacteriaceae bacterium]
MKDSVESALKSNNLGSISVSQDRDKGVITLTGNVQSQAEKDQAESIVNQTASGYTVADEIGVRPSGEATQAKAVQSDLDSAIEDNFKAAIKAHKDLDAQSISCEAKNGTLVLKGSVKTRAQKAQAFRLAKTIPNVQQVVNEIEVNPKKHSTAR